MEDYPVLKTISTLFNILGVICILISIIGIFLGLFFITDYSYRGISLYMIIGSLLFGLIFSLPWFAFGELIKLFIKIEHNTRIKTEDTKNSPIKIIQNFDKKSNYEFPSIEEWKKQNPGKSDDDYLLAKL